MHKHKSAHEHTHMHAQTLQKTDLAPPMIFFRLHTHNCQQHRLYTHTGWRRLIGCLKLQVNFRKRATNYRALLWKMTYEDKASYDSTPPWNCQQHRLHTHNCQQHRLYTHNCQQHRLYTHNCQQHRLHAHNSQQYRMSRRHTRTLTNSLENRLGTTDDLFPSTRT